HHHRQAGVAGQAEVDEVSGAEIDLGRTAGPLTHHDIELAAQLGDRGEGDLGKAPLRLEVAGPVDRADRAPAYDDLAAAVAARLEQHRVEADARLQPAGRGLQRLCPTDLPPVRGDGRGVGHVLR